MEQEKEPAPTPMPADTTGTPTASRGMALMSPSLYPFRLPYRRNPGVADPDMPVGKVPRMLSCAITTLARTGTGYDPATRVLPLGEGFNRLRQLTGLYRAPYAVESFRRTIGWMCAHDMDTTSGPIRMFEESAFPDGDVPGRWVRLTPACARMVASTRAAGIPLSALERSSHNLLGFDLVAVAAAWCPTDAPLRVSYDGLRLLLDLSPIYRWGPKWEPSLRMANRSQGRWSFVASSRGVRIVPDGVPGSARARVLNVSSLTGD